MWDDLPYHLDLIITNLILYVLIITIIIMISDTELYSSGGMAVAGWLEGPTGRVEQVCDDHDHDGGYDNHDHDHDCLLILLIMIMIMFMVAGGGGPNCNNSMMIMMIQRGS